jgi:hypothetical protein
MTGSATQTAEEKAYFARMAQDASPILEPETTIKPETEGPRTTVIEDAIFNITIGTDANYPADPDDNHSDDDHNSTSEAVASPQEEDIHEIQAPVAKDIVTPDANAHPALSAFDPQVLKNARDAIVAKLQGHASEAAMILALTATTGITVNELAAGIDFVLGTDRLGIPPMSGDGALALIVPAIADSRIVHVGNTIISTSFTDGLEKAVEAQFTQGGATNKDVWVHENALFKSIEDDHSHAHLPEDIVSTVSDRINTALHRMTENGRIAIHLMNGERFLRLVANDRFLVRNDAGQPVDLKTGEAIEG